MSIFTRQEQKFLLFLVAAFFVGLCTKYVRTVIEASPDDEWRRQREKIYSDFREKSKRLDQEKFIAQNKKHEKKALTKKLFSC